jgi:hypothetical protein
MQFVRSFSAHLAFTFALLAAAAIPATAAKTMSAAGFHVEDHWNIGGNGGWGFLAVDPIAHRLFIPRTDHVSVVDTRSGNVLATSQEW